MASRFFIGHPERCSNIELTIVIYPKSSAEPLSSEYCCSKNILPKEVFCPEILFRIRIRDFRWKA